MTSVRAKYGWPVGMPRCRPLGWGLWEVRSSLSGGRIARVIFGVRGEQPVLLHGFEKKAQKPPQPDLELARKASRRSIDERQPPYWLQFRE